MQLQIVPVAITHDPFVSEGWPLPFRAMRVVLYSRPGCRLCDAAREVIAAERARATFEFEEVDISLDDALEIEYGIRIPVVTIEGEERFEIEVDAARFGAIMRAG